MQRRHASYLQYLDDKYAARAGVTVRQLHEEMIMAPGFDTITAQTGTNALWLCTTDALTDAALRYCAAAKLSVPRDIGILSLENSPDHYHLSATACAPDWDLIGYLMAHSIIGDFPLNKTSHGYLRIPCPVIQRDTTYARR
jgi:DNA-binding LacI/PurR family transcriptional regulator